jgi:hypothetical protein
MEGLFFSVSPELGEILSEADGRVEGSNSTVMEGLFFGQAQKSKYEILNTKHETISKSQ